MSAAPPDSTSLGERPPAQSARRSLLFVPGDSLRKIEKSLTLEVDTVILDMEDGVALNRKESARQTVAQALATLDFAPRECIVRISAPGEQGKAEIRATCTSSFAPAGYLVPKAESPVALQAVDALLTELETAQSRPAGGIRLLAMIETALGIMNLREITTATSRLDALVFGAEDFAASTGARRTPEGWEILYARSAIATAAGAYGLQAIDCVHVDYQDAEGLRAECMRACNLGYTGKTLIHPAQVAVANELFSPSPAEIDWALRLTSAFDRHQNEGRGAFAFEDKMVDMPILRMAQRILARATQG